MNFFIILLTYKSSLEEIDLERDKHILFLDKYYKEDVFLLSGPKIPRTGGVILAKAKSENALWSFLKEDPFHVKNLAEYTIIPFCPTKMAHYMKIT
jgi:uncharacterized protein YciI